MKNKNYVKKSNTLTSDFFVDKKANEEQSK